MEEQETKKRIVVKAFKEFTNTDIRKAKDAKKHAFMMEMLAYNARAARGDFDTY